MMALKKVKPTTFLIMIVVAIYISLAAFSAMVIIVDAIISGIKHAFEGVRDGLKQPA
jgi:hypothetical protein